MSASACSTLFLPPLCKIITSLFRIPTEKRPQNSARTTVDGYLSQLTQSTIFEDSGTQDQNLELGSKVGKRREENILLDLAITYDVQFKMIWIH